MRSLAPLALSLSAATLIVTAAPSSADQVGTVPGATAAQQLGNGIGGTSGQAVDDLSGLTVKAKGSMTGYDRDLFPHWRDASTWGWPVEPNDDCDSRSAALYRDGEDVGMSSTCTKLTGTWVDPYGGGKYDAASDIDIDHVVPLGNAWATGAADWDEDERTAYANDPEVIVSADDSLNQSKSDQDPSEWVPPNEDAACLYATRWVLVKDKYDLWVTSAEKTKLSSMLETC